MIIVVPYRDRKEHLDRFLQHYQEFNIVIVEQLPHKPFNRGMLKNIGFDSTKSSHDHFIFHDVDMISQYPQDYLSSHFEPITHFATNCSQFDGKLPYKNYIGGILSISKKAFQDINGFPNSCWGWGAEDDILYQRIKKTKYKIVRKPNQVESLPHPRIIDENLKEINRKLLVKEISSPKILDDGLNSLDYKIVSVNRIDNFLHIIVDI